MLERLISWLDCVCGGSQSRRDKVFNGHRVSRPRQRMNVNLFVSEHKVMTYLDRVRESSRDYSQTPVP